MKYNVPHIRISKLQQSYICLTLLAAAVVAYLYFLNVSVVHVVMRKEATQEENQLRGEIASLETSYIEAQHKISNKIADAEGYDKNSEKIFVTRDSANLVLGNN